MDPIDEGAVELRVELANWPEGLDYSKYGATRFLHGKLTAAALTFSEYRAVRTAHKADTRLSAMGVHEANRLWIDDRLPAVLKSIDEVRAKAQEAQAGLLAKISECFAKPPESASDIAMAQEIRSWLRGLPAAERTDAVRNLVRSGDTSALRAVLTAPSYLTGLDAAELGFIREDAAKAADPERYETLTALRRAGEVAERAVEGVARFLANEVARPPLVESGPPAPSAETLNKANPPGRVAEAMAALQAA